MTPRGIERVIYRQKRTASSKIRTRRRLFSIQCEPGSLHAATAASGWSATAVTSWSGAAIASRNAAAGMTSFDAIQQIADDVAMTTARSNFATAARSCIAASWSWSAYWCTNRSWCTDRCRSCTAVTSRSCTAIASWSAAATCMQFAHQAMQTAAETWASAWVNSNFATAAAWSYIATTAGRCCNFATTGWSYVTTTTLTMKETSVCRRSQQRSGDNNCVKTN